MLRITVLNEAREAIFKMEGKLAHEWVEEANKAWTAFSSIPQQGRVVIDLSGVSFVDEPGRELLAQMHASGTQLVGSSPMISALIEEICKDDRPRRESWIQNMLGLLFMLLLSVAMASDDARVVLGSPAPKLVPIRGVELCHYHN